MIAMCSTGAASISAPTAAGDRAASAGINHWGGRFSVSEGCHNATGGTAGGQIGYRFQSSAPSCSASKPRATGPTSAGRNTSIPFGRQYNNTRIDAFGLFTGQIGYACQQRAALRQGRRCRHRRRLRILQTGTNLIATSTVSDTRWGGTVGVGLEYGFSPNWSAGVEYNQCSWAAATTPSSRTACSHR